MFRVLQDFRIAVRALAKSPVFTAVVVSTLALGIGAVTAIFSVVHAVLLEPLPYPESDRIVTLWETSQEDPGRKIRVTPANYLDWSEQNQVFEAVAVFGAAGLNLTGGGEPEQLLGVAVSADYFQVLGVAPQLGRAFLPEENLPGKERVVILGDGLWRRRFGGDPSIVGETLTFDGNPYLVVGVMPPGIYPTWVRTSGEIVFHPNYQQLWVPMALDESSKVNRRSHVYGVIARLKEESSLQNARAEMDTIARRLERQYPRWNQGAGIQIIPLVDEVVGNIRPALLVLFGAVACVLLIAGANVASILLARSAALQRETALRTALGASRLGLLRQFLCESIVVALLAGGLGTVLASAGINVLLELIPEEVPRQSEVAISGAVLGFVLAASMVTGVLLGLVSAFQSFHLDLHQSLKEGGRSFIGGSGKHRLRRVLVVAEVGLATALLVGSALLIQSYWRLRQVDPGFRHDNVLVLDLLLPQSSYGEWHEITSFYSHLLERIESLAGVQSVAVAYNHPLETSWYNGFGIEGRTQTDIEPVGKYRPVSPGYFRTVGVTLLSGRSFTAEDDPHHPGVVIVNDRLVREYFPDEDPIGQWLTIDPPSAIWGDVMPKRFEVIGVVGDVKFSGLDAGVEPAFYIPAAQSPLRDMSLAVHTVSAPLDLVENVRQEIWTLDPDLPISGVTTMSAVLDSALAQPRFNMLLLGLFGAMSLLLAAIGIYGLLSYTVNQRTNEIGIRMALGAQGEDITGLVVGHGLRLTLMGIGLGCASALGLTWIMESLLFGVSETDPMTFLAVAVFLTGVALLASYLPARRATRVDPLAALRME